MKTKFSEHPTNLNYSDHLDWRCSIGRQFIGGLAFMLTNETCKLKTMTTLILSGE